MSKICIPCNTLTLEPLGLQLYSEAYLILLTTRNSAWRRKTISGGGGAIKNFNSKILQILSFFSSFLSPPFIFPSSFISFPLSFYHPPLFPPPFSPPPPFLCSLHHLYNYVTNYGSFPYVLKFVICGNIIYQFLHFFPYSVETICIYNIVFKLRINAWDLLFS